MNVLLGVTGSVAAKLTPRLAEAIRVHASDLKIVATEKSFFFWRPVEVMSPIFRDSDEWHDYQPGMPVLHIELRKWADVLVLAPLTANTLAKIANGMADNLLTSIVRAWDLSKPMVLAPAMNTQMWYNPVTNKHLTEISQNFPRSIVISPVSKVLACGDEGIGAMAPVEKIVQEMLACTTGGSASCAH